MTRTVQVQQQTYQVAAMLFDKDGTLLDLDRLWSRWLVGVLEALETRDDMAPLNHSALAEPLGLRADGTIDRRGPLAIGAMNDVISIIALGLHRQHNLAWNDAMRMVENAREVAEAEFDWREHITAMPGVVAFLEQAETAGIKLGVVTSDNQVRAREHLLHLAMSNVFSVVLGHDSVARGKPFPDMVAMACQALDVLPHQVILFGDSNGDMQMSRDAGLQAGIGIEPIGVDARLTAANQVIPDYHDCQIF